MSSENQKKGQEALGRTIKTDKAIPIENFITMQDDGQINAIYLVMTTNNDQLISLAKKVGLIITQK